MAQGKQQDSQSQTDLAIQNIQLTCGSSDLVGESEASIGIKAEEQ